VWVLFLTLAIPACLLAFATPETFLFSIVTSLIIIVVGVVLFAVLIWVS
jgi:hypothetical protein